VISTVLRTRLDPAWPHVDRTILDQIMNLPIEASLVLFQKHGVRFLYPDIWELEESETDDSIVITVSSDGTCFWSMHILHHCPPPPQVVESCVAAFTEEYDDADQTPAERQLAEMRAFARDVEFSCFELMNTAALQCVRTTEFTLLVLWQGTDHELVEFRDLLESMTDSVRAESLLDDSQNTNDTPFDNR
jgi:hypothetical protein